MSGNIIEDWLRSLDLVQYTQSFLDNGYDDLEVCKQIGPPDLDAIGVSKKEHREDLLKAVRLLREEGGTAVYFTLEDSGRPYRARQELFGDTGTPRAIPPDTLDTTSTKNQQPLVLDNLLLRSDAYEEGKSAIVTYPRVQLRLILRDKLTQDNVDLSSPTFSSSESQESGNALVPLAVKYARELKTHVKDVHDRLEEIQQCNLTKDGDSTGSLTPQHSHSLYGFSHHGGPPPIPACPPPASSHAYKGDMEGSLISINNRYDTQSLHTNYAPLESDYDFYGRADKKGFEKKKGLSFGRFLRNMGLRRSAKKHGLKTTQNDILASEITMSDEDRIALMVMVKEGKLSTDMALDVVKKFEDDKRYRQDSSPSSGLESQGSMKERTTDKGRRQYDASKTVKSASAIYGENTRCQVCHGYLPQDYEEPVTPCGGDCCRQRRVHSIGHVEFPTHSPQVLRSLSSPGHVVSSPAVSRVYGQDLHSRTYSPVLMLQTRQFGVNTCMVHSANGFQENPYSGRTSAQIPKTNSRTSLISSTSENSVESASVLQNRVNGIINKNCDTHQRCSAPGMHHKNSPAVGRKKSIDTHEKRLAHKLQRSRSYSPGEDYVSSEEDDELRKKLLHEYPMDNQSKKKFGDKLRDMKSEIRKLLKPGDSKKSPRQGLVLQNGKGTQHRQDSVPSIPEKQSVSHQSQPREDRSSTGSDILPSYVRIHTDYTPQPLQRDALRLQKGDIVKLLKSEAGDIAVGMFRGKIGLFPLTHAETIGDGTPLVTRKERPIRRRNSRRTKPTSVEELMQRLGLEHLTNVFMMNGYDQLETIADLDEEDLDTLQINESDERAKILTAAELINDYESPEASETYSKSEASSVTPQGTPSMSPAAFVFDTQTFKCSPASQDSGCYASSEHLQKNVLQKTHSMVYTNGIPQSPGADRRYYPTTQNQQPCTENNQNIQQNNQFYPKMTQCQVLNAYVVSNKTINGYKSGTHDEINERVDRDLISEEDKEVQWITYGCVKKPSVSSKGHSECSSAGYIDSGLNTSYSSCGTQTSPKSRTVEETPSTVQGDVRRTPCNSSDNSESTPSDLSDTSSPIRKVKPVPPPRVSSLTNPMSPRVGKKCLHRQDRVGSPLYGTLPSLSSFSNRRDAFTQFDHSAKRQHSQGGKDKSKPDNKSVEAIRSIDNSSPSHFFPNPETGLKEPIYGKAVKGYKNVSKAMIPFVTSKLAVEKIDLTQEPYSNQTGNCGIPPLLVQRYAEELGQDIASIAVIMEQLRVHLLHARNKPAVPNNDLPEVSRNACDLKIANVKDFLVSIGLPMYLDDLAKNGCTTIEQLLNVKDNNLEKWTGANKQHLKRLNHAVEWVKTKLSSPTRKGKVSTVKDRV